jgi:hypothetical protein
LPSKSTGERRLFNREPIRNRSVKKERKTMQTGRSKWASGILLSLLLAPPAAADLLNFSYTGGVQTFTAPADGLYQIIADGASGGNSSSSFVQFGGRGAEIGGTFALTAGEILSIYVGGMGADVGGGGAGGGGGSFVVDPSGNPLIVAGGGGGAGPTSDGGDGLIDAASSTGGTADAGSGGGGGGFTSNGANGFGGGGKGFPGGLAGGAGAHGGGSGGFGGGGGGGGSAAGGGGGYSGGDGTPFAGTGGGSFDADLIDPSLQSGVNSGNGKVEIDFAQAAVPEPASCVLFGTILLGIGVKLRRSRPGSSAKSVNSRPN